MNAPFRSETAEAATIELSQTVANSPERSRGMPPSVYRSPGFTALELSKIFAKEWICVGRADMLADPGDYVTMKLAGSPIMVVRDGQGQLRAQSNVCLHRMSTLLEGAGNTSSIVCPYHAWTYNLDGRLRGAPGMTKNEAFEKSKLCLPQLPLIEWQGWVFVTLNPEAEDPTDKLRGAAALVEPYGMANYTQTFYERHHWATNWKVLAENFMESYHLPVCHAGTIGGFVDLEEMDCPEGGAGYNFHTILKTEDAPLTNAHPDNTTLKGDLRRTTLLLSVYPALFVTLTPGYFWYLSLHPDGPGHVHVTYGGGLSPDYVNDPASQEHFKALKTLLDAVNDEDRGCTERVYQGLCSELASAGPLSHLERPNYEFAQYIHRMVSAP